jgi:hypothetical protein
LRIYSAWFLHTVLQLSLAIGTIEMAQRGGDQSIGGNLPKLEALCHSPK